MVTFLKGGDPIYEGQDNPHRKGYNSGMIVYKITNLVNGKFYIGITKRLLCQRWGRHMYDARRGAPYPLQRAIAKYGPGLFKRQVLKVCASVEEMKAEEIRLIALWGPEYNASKGGESRNGAVTSPETRVKQSVAKKGIVLPHMFRKATAETRLKMSVSQRGCKKKQPIHNIENLLRVGMATRLRQARKVVCQTHQLEFDSVCLAAKHYNMYPAQVQKVCAGMRKAARGLEFRYGD